MTSLGVGPRLGYMKTSDITLATTISLWILPEKIERIKNSNKVFFVYPENKKIDDIVEKYWRRELRVEPRSFFDQLRALKGQIYATE